MIHGSTLYDFWSQVRTWAPGMLERLDAALGGRLDRTLPALDVVPPFAAAICWSGLLFDLAVPFALLLGGPRLRWGVALPAAASFNALNKAWFGLGVFPYLMLASLVLFFPPSPPPSTSAAAPRRHPLPAADAAADAANSAVADATATCKDKGGRSRSPAHLRARHVATVSTGAASATSAAATSTVAANDRARSCGRRQQRTTLALCAYAALHVLAPLRHVGCATAVSPSWTDEGALYAWRMKLVDKTGWLALRVSLVLPAAAAAEPEAAAAAAAAAAAVAAAGGAAGGGGGGRGEGGNGGGEAGAQAEVQTWWLVPETDASLYVDQAGAVVHSPPMTLAYVSHVAAAFAARGAAVASIHAVSCVAVNGRSPQPLFNPHADLLQVLAQQPSAPPLLTPWRAAGAPPLCNLSALHGAPTDTAAQQLQLASDAAYRWLYAPLAARSSLSEWPWSGRHRTATAQRDGSAGAAVAGAAVAARLPIHEGHWLARCSFLQAMEALWCPIHDSVAHGSTN